MLSPWARHTLNQMIQDLKENWLGHLVLIGGIAAVVIGMSLILGSK